MKLGDLQPFGNTDCKACGMATHMEHPRMRYCEGECIPSGFGYVNVATAGSAPRPHLHVKCGRCEYEWLTQTKQ